MKTTFFKTGLSSAILLATTISLNAVTLFVGPPEVMSTNVPDNPLPIGATDVVVDPFNWGGSTFNPPYMRDYADNASNGQFNLSSGTLVNAPNSSPFSAGPNEGRFGDLRQSGGNDGVLTLTLASARNYLGFAWLAADPFNRIELYSGNDLITSLNTAALTNLFFDGSTLVANDGETYDTEEWFGQPGSNGTVNEDEYYTFLHIAAEQEFDTIIFRATSDLTNFEIDNITVANIPSRYTPPGEWIEVPEPSAYAVLVGLVAAAVVFNRRRR